MSPQLYRISGLLDLSAIRQQTICFVGVGSLGSHILSLLAYPFKHIILIDPDKLESANVERHVLGYDSVGRYKATAAKRWLIRNRGLDKSSIIAHRCHAEQVLHRYPEVDLIIETTGSQVCRQNINYWSHSRHIPALYASIYPRGTGGEAVLIANPDASCFQCFESDQGGNSNQPDIPVNYGIGPVQLNEQTGEVMEAPYLSGPVSATAADAQDLALGLLMGSNRANQWIIQAHNDEAMCRLPEGELAAKIRAWNELQPILGFVPNLELVGNPQGSLTLLGSRATFSGIIQPSAGCTFHFAAAS